MGWREDQRVQRAAERRADEDARADRARRDALAAAEVDAIRAHIQLEVAQTREERRLAARRHTRKEREAARERARDKVRQRWRARRAAVRAWLVAHVVDLLVYPLAVVSAVMAIPAMTAYGARIYTSATGYALPGITELGMWAFAIAVQVSRHRSPDRPVWALQLGVWAFSGVAGVTNALHGFEQSLVDGFVMGLVSVAGVMAHQLVTASPRRSRTERDRARVARRARHKLAAVRRIAVRDAVAQIDDTGNARLVFAPGFYDLTTAQRNWRRWFPERTLTAAPAPGGDPLDRELAALLADPAALLDSRPGSQLGPGREIGPDSGWAIGWASGGVATLDPTPDPRPDARPEAQPGPRVDRHVDSPGDQHGSTSTPGPTARRRSSRQRVEKSNRSGHGSAHGSARGSGRRPARSIEELRTELAAMLAADPGSVNVSSAESIRRALRCRPKAAQQLRDEHGRR